MRTLVPLSNMMGGPLESPRRRTEPHSTHAGYTAFHRIASRITNHQAGTCLVPELHSHVTVR